MCIYVCIIMIIRMILINLCVYAYNYEYNNMIQSISLIKIVSNKIAM